MRLSAIVMSRVIAIPPRLELNPFGRVFLPSLIPLITERYKFLKSPSSFEDAAKDGGLVFEQGYAEECGTITKLTAYEQGLTIESRAHSSSGRATLLGLYNWLASDHGLLFDEGMIRKWLYVTDLTFYSDALLDDLNPSLNILRQAMTKLNEEMGRPPIPFSTTQIAVNHDKTVLDFPQTSFSIARDLSSAFTENKYFSESPFPSEKHLEILEEFERSVLKYAGK